MLFAKDRSLRYEIGLNSSRVIDIFSLIGNLNGSGKTKKANHGRVNSQMLLHLVTENDVQRRYIHNTQTWSHKDGHIMTVNFTQSPLDGHIKTVTI